MTLTSNSGHQTNSYCDMYSSVWACTFRVSNLKHSNGPLSYSVLYRSNPSDPGTDHSYSGLVPLPVDDPVIVNVGCFGPDATKNKSILVESILSKNSDIVWFSGDQSYEHGNLQYGVLELVYTTSAISQNIPTIVSMDDHDYALGNVYGAGANENASHLSGDGYSIGSPCEIKDIERLSLAHMPDPAFPNLRLENGMRTHFGEFYYSEKVSFGMLESRKFKQNLGEGNRDGTLLGAEQLQWLGEWTQNRSDRVRVLL